MSGNGGAGRWRWATRLGLAWLALVIVAAGGWFAYDWWRGGGRLYHFDKGQRLVYDLHYESDASADFSQLFRDPASPEAGEASPGLKRTVTSTIKGRLVVIVLETRSDRVSLAVRFEKASVELISNGEPLTKESKKIRKDLTRPVFVEMDRQGRILGLRLDPEAAELSNSTIRTLLGSCQFVLPGRGGSLDEGWDTEEDDPNGTSAVRYDPSEEDVENKGCRAFQKSRTHYLEPEDRPAPGPGEFRMAVQTDPVGTIRAEIDTRRGRLVSLAGTQISTVFMQSKQVSESTDTIKLELVEEGHDHAAREELATRRSRVVQLVARSTLVNPDGGEAAERVLQKSELGGNDLKGLLVKLKAAEGLPPKEVNETQLYLKFRALVYLKPATATRLAEELKKVKSGTLTMRVLAAALGKSHTQAGQKALIDVARSRPGDWPLQAEILPALGMQTEPTRETEEFLFSVSDSGPTRDIRTTAELALGIMARTLAGTNPARAKVIVDWALRELKRARTVSGQRQMLLVLGNTATPRTLPVIKKYLDARNPDLRGAAIGALLWHTGRKTDEVLIRALVSDKDAGVRQEGARVWEGRLAAGLYPDRPLPREVVAAHIKAFRQDESVSVRLAVLNTLARVRESYPEAEKLLNRAAESDPDKDVKKAARELLGEVGD